MRILSLSCRVLLLTLGASCAQALPASDPQQAIPAAYAQMDAAIAQKNINGFFVFHHPQYVATNEKGVHKDTAQERRQLTNIFRSAQTMSLKTTVQKITVKGKEATAEVTQAMTATALDGHTGKKSTLDAKESDRDLWVKTAKGWQLKSVLNLSDSFTVDGKPSP